MAPSVGGWNFVPHGVGRDQWSGSSSASDGRSSRPSPRSHHSLNEAWVRMSAPVSARSRAAPPKWSGWLWVTTTVWIRASGMPARAKPVEQAVPGLRAGQTGIDDGEAALVLQRVAVDVTEAGEHDRQLHPQRRRGRPR